MVGGTCRNDVNISGNGSMVNGDGNEMRKMGPEESRGGAARHKIRGN